MLNVDIDMLNEVPELAAHNVRPLSIYNTERFLLLLLFRHYGRKIIGRPAHVAGLNDADTYGFRVWSTMKRMWPNRSFALTGLLSSMDSTISKQDMPRDIFNCRTQTATSRGTRRVFNRQPHRSTANKRDRILPGQCARVRCRVVG
jgi:hypothetical protein